ncbi:hypothetical protein Scep_009989 [Stephania cephalantha]|uniref:Uncharacterized protein n=1 Tax=Stephania cephalantha TaxID=152367 RepID=A0AAP0JU63_9MAGN
MDAAVSGDVVEVNADGGEVSEDGDPTAEAEREGREAGSAEREEDREDSAHDNRNGRRRERRSVQRDEGGKEGVETDGGGEAVGAKERDEDRSRKMRAGVETDGGGEAVGAEDRAERLGEVTGAERDEVGENLSKSALAARTESEPAEEMVGAEAVRGVQRRLIKKVDAREYESNIVELIERKETTPLKLLMPQETVRVGRTASSRYEC